MKWYFKIGVTVLLIIAWILIGGCGEKEFDIPIAKDACGYSNCVSFCADNYFPQYWECVEFCKENYPFDPIEYVENCITEEGENDDTV